MKKICLTYCREKYFFALREKILRKVTKTSAEAKFLVKGKLILIKICQNISAKTLREKNPPKFANFRLIFTCCVK
jgi:hypothetical protein